jgi:FkbM family methyltransferase
MQWFNLALIKLGFMGLENWDDFKTELVEITFEQLHKLEGYNGEFEIEILSNQLYKLREANNILECNNGLLFLNYLYGNYRPSKSQLFQDLYVLYKLSGMQNGFFVEFGATDGLNLSNSFLLEKTYGWSGIVAEPFPFWHKKLSQNRECIIEHRCVWFETGKKIDFIATENKPEYATLSLYKNVSAHNATRASDTSSKVIEVETISLTDMLASYQAPKNFEYLSIDTEGSEFEILNSLDFSRFKPKIITIEHNFDKIKRNNIYYLLSNQGYIREFENFSKYDDWYYHPSLTN